MHTRNRWIVLAGLALAGVGTLGAAPDVGERALALRQLARVKDPARLEFARAAIERIAKDPATRETLAEYARTLLQRFPAR